EWDVSEAEKGGYSHFMLKEIMEQPESIRKTVQPRLKNSNIVFEELESMPELIQNVSKIYIVACGSAYHVGMVGKYTLEKLLRKPVETCLASEFRYSEPLVDSSTLVIVISQSGETLDSLAALREAKKNGAKILSIVNVIGSTVARESDVVLYTWAGPEIAVATTKAYSTQMILLTMLGVYFAKQLNKISADEYDAFIADLEILPDKMSQVLSSIDTYQQAAYRYFNHDSVFFIGRNLDYALGLEGSLKLKEISYIHSESYAAGELKHGTISLIEPGTLVVAIATYNPLVEKMISNIVEVQSRGAEVISVTTEAICKKIAAEESNTFIVPEIHPLLQPNLGVIPLQLFAFYVALNRGCDIDKPRNLAKSVTVE
ncbi:MAG: glutamine--fructose-6-phosphate transaminase (isomerizing), partial [Clostridia bacterium]|nr:glutamine--fructose-6-phosphate transaminase (isomerizing) [Clostridia bacterium]